MPQEIEDMKARLSKKERFYDTCNRISDVLTVASAVAFIFWGIFSIGAPIPIVLVFATVGIVLPLFACKTIAAEASLNVLRNTDSYQQNL